ncbi:MAG TPA: hypothetical protein VNG33_06415, partial [Polyangiaceae bacterium]|nr:hypothetical protein [Polyangiaceae bacterium]
MRGRRPASRLGIGPLLFFVVLFWQAACLAQPELPREVEVVLVGALGDDPVFASRVTSWFAPDRFHVSVRRARFLEPKQVLSPSSDAAVHVWVTLSGQTLARLYFASAGSNVAGASYFLRELRLANGFDEIGAEHVAEVLNLSTQAFLEREAQSAREVLEETLKAEAVPEREAAAVPAAPVAKPGPAATPPRDGRTRSESPRDWGARVGYAVSYRADEGTWHGPSAAFDVALWRKLGLRAAAQGALPGQRELEPLELRFYGVAFVLAASLRHALGAGITLQWFGGPSLDVVRYAPVRPLSMEYAAGKAATEARPGVAGGVVALWGTWPVVALVAQATVPFTKTHYD